MVEEQVNFFRHTIEFYILCFPWIMEKYEESNIV